MKRILVLMLVVVFALFVLSGCSSKTASGGYKDGTYKAEQPNFDSHGWKGQIEITVKDGKIASVTYNEVNKDGQFKRNDQQYAEKMKEKTNITPKEADEKLEQQLIEKQDPAKVDTVTGATETSKTFKELATEALKSAK
ncbi:Major membrane immunogen, membrane-anchored lipoprotein [Thermoanaerobacter thermohydrosulfuricus WC1]|uniref:Major membrane immunogen, membrane-anchored lipoprotein n=1 Tax=Thermoanaerobacter thermohydrosulfuricus WC1 TaxID=1198630 RepID=M8CRU1_THETY|nr:FMN-binding protein [Thermoanaerobacter thermohydrosulfuricus]EMT39885.1 Major membrane immunogen, membrane-anchored lipoprotein [Thermoanaerobacter thermohydrosulfuricus WC1]